MLSKRQQRLHDRSKAVSAICSQFPTVRILTEDESATLTQAGVVVKRHYYVKNSWGPGTGFGWVDFVEVE